MSKENKKALPPRRKHMKREGRLQRVKDTGWIGKYEGKNIVRGYSRWFGVDLQCAMKELSLLGYSITEKDRQRVHHSIESKQIERQKRKEKREQQLLEEELLFGDDAEFFFIAGYTAGGAPFGLTYEEMEEMEKMDEKKTRDEKSDFKIPTSSSRNYIDDDGDLPF